MTPIERALQPTASEWGSSRFGEFRRCQVAHALKHEQLIELKPRPADDLGEWEAPDVSYFEVGSIVHYGLRFVQDAVRLQDSDPSDWKLVLDAHVAKGGDGMARLEAERLLEAYWSHYGLENAGWPEGTKIMAVELPLEVPEGVLGPLPYTATADAILELPGGEVVIVDHKTRARMFPSDRSGYARGLSTRPQFAGLSWLVRRELKLREPPPIWVNGIVKPTKTISPRFDRLLVKIPEARLTSWEAMQTLTARDMNVSDLRCPTPDWSNCAPEVGSRCSYFLHCHGSDEERERHYQRRKES